MPDVVQLDIELGLRMRLLQDLMDETMKSEFQRKYVKDGDLYELLQNENPDKINKICAKNHDYKRQLLPERGMRVTIDSSFDTKLLANLLSYLCDGIAKKDLKVIVNTRHIISHKSLSMSEDEFNKFYQEVKGPLLRLGCPEKAYESVRHSHLDSRRLCQRYNFSAPVADFIGREKELQELNTKMEMIEQPGSKYGVVISGLDSVGKSELLWQYFDHLKGKEDENWFCLEASTSLELEESFRKLMDYVFPAGSHVHNGESMSDMADKVTLVYGVNSPIFVLENVDENGEEFENLLQVFKYNNARLLITTRLDNWEQYNTDLFVIRLNVFSVEDALTFVKKCLSEDKIGPRDLQDSALREFVSICNCHPAILKTTVVYLNSDDCQYKTVTDWNQAFLNGDVSMVTPSRRNNGKNLTSDEWEQGMVRRYGEETSTFLRLVCFLNCRNLEKRILVQLVEGDAEATGRIIEQLKTLSLLHVCCGEGSMKGNEYYTITSIELEDIRDRVSVQTADEILNIMFWELQQVDFADGIHHSDTWSTWCRHYFFMFRKFRRREDVYERFVKFTYEFVDRLVFVFQSKGLLSKWQQVLDTVQAHQMLTSSQHKRLKVRLKLAECYLREGLLQAAYQLLRDMEKQDGFESRTIPVKFGHQYTLGRCLKEKGLYDEAIKTFKELQTNACILARQKDQMICIRNDIFICYRKSGKLQDARKYYKNLISLFGNGRNNNKNSASAQHVKGNMALCLQQLRQFDHSLSLYNEVLTQQKFTYGEFHPNHMSTLANKATCLRDMGWLDDALQLCEEVLTSLYHVLGPTNQLYLTALFYKGKCLLEYRCYDEAMDCFQEVRRVREKKLGVDHPTYFAVLMIIALCLGEQKETVSALECFVDLRNSISLTVGNQHPLLADVEYHTAKCYYVNAEYEKALEKYFALSDLLKALKIDRLALATKSMMGRCYMKMGDQKKAFMTFQQLQKEQEKIYQHKNDALLLETKRDIAECVMWSGQPQKAYEILIAIKELQIAELKTDHHPSVKDTEVLIQQSRDLVALVDDYDVIVLRESSIWQCCKVM